MEEDRLNGFDEEMMEEVRKFLEPLDEEERGRLLEALENADPEALLFGECPCCGGLNITDSSRVEGIENPTVGFCPDCGFIWCLECGSLMPGDARCGHWRICEECPEEKDEFGDCGVETYECGRIQAYLDENGSEALLGSCAWCGKEVGDSEVFGMGVRTREGVSLENMEGGVISMFLSLSGKVIPSTVTAKDSEARADGYDLTFMTCSLECGLALKAALERETRIIDRSA
ncbi:MAG: hypothetical protein KJ686_08140 [Actinobacteria bacterium]|nr:hypothetical protein [Actinomycetota bacterium]